MKVEHGNIWAHRAVGDWVCITTNGIVKDNGENVMGVGVAKQASERYHDLALRIGSHISASGNIPGFFDAEKIISFPVKHHWNDNADLVLIKDSAQDIADTARELAEDYVIHHIFSPFPGCGAGGLKWEQVRPVIEPIFDERFTLVEYVDQSS